MLTAFSLILWNSIKLGSIYFSTVFLLYHNKMHLKSRGCCLPQRETAWVLNNIEILNLSRDKLDLKLCKINIHEHSNKEVTICFSTEQSPCLRGLELCKGVCIKSRFCALDDFCPLLAVWSRALHSAACSASHILQRSSFIIIETYTSH